MEEGERASDGRRWQGQGWISHARGPLMIGCMSITAELR